MSWDIADFTRALDMDLQMEPWQEEFLRRVYASRPQPSDVVHVITTLGPTDEPGLIVHAEFLTGHGWRS